MPKPSKQQNSTMPQASQFDLGVAYQLLIRAYLRAHTAKQGEKPSSKEIKEGNRYE